jgi:hypothetical protein
MTDRTNLRSCIGLVFLTWRVISKQILLRK